MKVRAHIVGISVMMLLLACACSQHDEKRIQVLQRQFREAREPAEKSAIAQELHRAYSLYHLENPMDTTYLLDWAALARTGGELETALNVYDAYLGIDKTNAAVLEKRARLHHRMGFYKRAAKDFEQAAKEASDTKKKSFLLRSYRAALAVDSTLRSIQKALRSGTEVRKNLLSRAELYLANDQYAAARMDIERLSVNDPENPGGLYYTALFEAYDQHYRAALAQLEMMLSRSEPGEEYYQDALELKQKMKAHLQLDSLRILLEDRTGDYHLLLELGRVHFNLEQYPQSAEYFSAAIRAFPDSALGYIYRAQSLLQQGQLRASLTDFNKALEIEPENINTHNLLAYNYLLLKDFEKVRAEVAYIRSRGGTLLEVLEPYAPENTGSGRQ